MKTMNGMNGETMKVTGVPKVHDHPVMLSDLQFELILALASHYSLIAHQHSNIRRVEWGQVAEEVVHDVLEILGVRIPKDKENIHDL